MIDKDTIRDLILRECDICLHLHGKLPEGSLGYRPTPGQRSTLELLRHLAGCALGGVRVLTEGDGDVWAEVAAPLRDLAADAFPAAMERQKEALRAYFDGLTQDDLETRQATTPWGASVPLEVALVQMPLHWMVGYRMQLFLYAKQAGNDRIGTADCWAGVDGKRRAAEDAPA